MLRPSLERIFKVTRVTELRSYYCTEKIDRGCGNVEDYNTSFTIAKGLDPIRTLVNEIFKRESRKIRLLAVSEF